jgi:hypothetical protein
MDKCPHNNWLQSIQKDLASAPVGGKYCVVFFEGVMRQNPAISTRPSHFTTTPKSRTKCSKSERCLVIDSPSHYNPVDLDHSKPMDHFFRCFTPLSKANSLVNFWFCLVKNRKSPKDRIRKNLPALITRHLIDQTDATCQHPKNGVTRERRPRP